MKEVLAEARDFKIGGRIINNVRLTDVTAISVKTLDETHCNFSAEIEITWMSILPED